MTRAPSVTKRGSREDTNRTAPGSTASKQPKPVVPATTSTSQRVHIRDVLLSTLARTRTCLYVATKTVHRLGSGVTPHGPEPANSSKVVTDTSVRPKLTHLRDHQQ